MGQRPGYRRRRHFKTGRGKPESIADELSGTYIHITQERGDHPPGFCRSFPRLSPPHSNSGGRLYSPCNLAFTTLFASSSHGNWQRGSLLPLRML